MSLEYVYSAGTISVGNNSTSVTGVGTQFVAEGIREGDDFRANGLVATIASVNSNTSITLKNGWPGSSISSGDYSIRQYDNADRALPAFNSLLLALGSGTLTSLAALSTSANQMPYFTGAGVMNITGLTSQARSLLASTLLGASGNNLVTSTDTRLTGGAVTQSDQDATEGRLLKVGDGGVLGRAVNYSSAESSQDFDDTIISGFIGSSSQFSIPANSPDGTPNRWFAGWASGYPGRAAQFLARYSGGSGNSVFWRIKNENVWGAWFEIFHSNNAIVDSNGFIKEASPIVRLYDDRTEEPVEAVGASVTRNGVGSYTLSGVPPLATDGWQIEVPKDHNGNRLVFVETEYDAATETLTITTSKPVWSMGTMSWAAGDPVDIPEGRWVDLRFWKDPTLEEDPEEE